MKKYIIMFIFIILLTGCGKKKVVCRIEDTNEEIDYLEKAEMIGYLDNDDKVTDVEVKYYLEKKAASLFCSYYKCDDNVLTISSADKEDDTFGSFGYEIDEMKGLTREKFIDYVKSDSDLIKCK